MIWKYIGFCFAIGVGAILADAILTGWFEFRPEPPNCFRCGEPMKLGKDRVFHPACTHQKGEINAYGHQA